MLNETIFLQILMLTTLWFFLKAINLFTLWYLSGLYLILLGLFLFLSDGDIFVGFLWIIDFGVGLIFFIFLLHFSSFLYQKATVNVFQRYMLFGFFFLSFILIFFFFLNNTNDSNYNYNLKKSWFFYVSWYNFFTFFNHFFITNLNLLKEIYFFNNSLEFFVINFMLFYGILISIVLSFSLKSFFNTLLLSQFTNLPLLKTSESVFFIRNQNFVKQQHTSTGTRVWIKKQKMKN